MSNVFVAPSAEDLVEFEATWPQEEPAPPPLRWSPGRVLRVVGGLDENRLEPADRAYYTRLLVLIVGASVMATVSLSAALSMTTGAGMTGWPLLAGVGCGALIATNDLAITMPDPYRRKGWIPTAGRMAFAVLFGPMVALPLTAAIFAQDVDHHLAEQRQVEAQHASVDFDARRPGIETAVAETHRPAVRAATVARDGAQEDLARAQQAAALQVQACNAEITGAGGSGLVGEGPRASALCTTAGQLAATETRARARVDEAEGQLQAAIGDQRRAVDAAVAVARPVVTPFDPGELGVIDRIETTHERLGWWSWLIAGSLVLLDLSPAICHLCSRTRPYELALDPAVSTRRPSVVDQLDAIYAAGDQVEDDLQKAKLDDWLRARRRATPRPSNNELWREAVDAELWDQSLSTFNRYLRKRRLGDACRSDLAVTQSASRR